VALDPDFAVLLSQPHMQLVAPPPEVTPPMLRQLAKMFKPTGDLPPIASSRDIEIAGPAGRIAIRLYSPERLKPAPLILFFYGGGWVLGDLDSHEYLCRDLANGSGCTVAAVDYRLAPEVPFPGGLDDCYAALEFIAANAGDYGLDRTRIAVCGDSAGGNLAAAVVLKSRAQRGPPLRYQALMCPALDSGCDSSSMHANGIGYMLSRGMMQWFWKCYLAKPGDASNPLASPTWEANMSGLPPTTIVTAEFDPLRDDGDTYASRLRDAGVPVTTRRYLGMIHDFMAMPHITAVARRSIADTAGDIAAALTGPESF
jgi:acetyl esterase/lipase